jgi:hypothetical protein
MRKHENGGHCPANHPVGGLAESAKSLRSNSDSVNYRSSRLSPFTSQVFPRKAVLSLSKSGDSSPVIRLRPTASRVNSGGHHPSKSPAGSAPSLLSMGCLK